MPLPGASQTSRAWRVMRVILAIIVTPIVLVAAVVLVLVATPWGNERVRRIVVSQANIRITGALAIGELRGNLLHGATLTNISVTDSGHQPVFTARRADVRYALLPALRGRIVIQSLVLDRKEP